VSEFPVPYLSAGVRSNTDSFYIFVFEFCGPDPYTLRLYYLFTKNGSFKIPPFNKTITLARRLLFDQENGKYVTISINPIK